MLYTVGELARLSGVSPRALRLYDQMGLLVPERSPDNGYRLYGAEQVNTLQQILFYRELGMGLEDIAAILRSPGFDLIQALESHCQRLLEQKRRTDALLQNVQNTLNALNGGKTMKDVEKFEGFKRRMIRENEETYGAEIRAAYGSDVIEASNRKVSGMSQEQWNRRDELGRQINEALKAAMAEGDPAGEKARALCAVHKEWLCMSWPDGMYTKEIHCALAQGYMADKRFQNYYDGAAGDGATAFLSRALESWAQN